MNSIEKRKPHGNSRLAKIGRPALRRKKKAGAPKGNKNGLRHGRYTAEMKARHARLTDLRRRASALTAHIEALVRERKRRAEESALADAQSAALPASSQGAQCAHVKMRGAPLLQIGHGATE